MVLDYAKAREGIETFIAKRSGLDYNLGELPRDVLESFAKAYFNLKGYKDHDFKSFVDLGADIHIHVYRGLSRKTLSTLVKCIFDNDGIDRYDDIFDTSRVKKVQGLLVSDSDIFEMLNILQVAVELDKVAPLDEVYELLKSDK